MDFTVDDFLPMCDKCSGSGRLENSEPKQKSNSYGQRSFPLSKGINCDSCNGKGFVLTKSGEALIEFLSRARNKGFLLN